MKEKNTHTTVRTVGGITYQLTRKQVKNINLRVRADGSVTVSAGPGVALREIDRFIAQKEAWILAASKRLAQRAPSQGVGDFRFSDRECMQVFEEISDKIYPLFVDTIKSRPVIKVRFMTSCWGVCHPQKGYITLNKALLSKPRAAIEYVVLHEYVHFLHPDHQKGFHDTMGALMPDYRERRKLLKTT